MFDLMNMCTVHPPKGKENENIKIVGLDTIKIVGLDQRMSDLFLDVFAGDYIKIMKEMERKKEAKGISQEDMMAKKYNNPISLTTKAQGIGGLNSNFGKKKDKNVRDSSTMSREENSRDRHPMKIDENGGGTIKRQETIKKPSKPTNQEIVEAATAKIKKPEDTTFFLTEIEFQNIHFENDWPLIIKDLAFYFTNQDLLRSQRIDEKVEHPHMLTLGIEPKESEFQIYRNSLLP